MRRFWMLLPVVFAAAVGCGDTPTVATNAETEAQQKAAEKQVEEEEGNMKNGAYDPSAPKPTAKKRK